MTERDCPFCQIVRGDRPADFVYRGDSVVVFKDIRPAAPIHLLVVPTKHIRSINELGHEDGGIVAEMVYRAREVARELSVAQKGYRLTINVERGGGQYIWHLHMHFMSRG